MSPSLGVAIGTTYLPAAAAKVGTKFEVECRGERMAAEVVTWPFWKKGSARKKDQSLGPVAPQLSGFYHRKPSPSSLFSLCPQQ